MKSEEQKHKNAERNPSAFEPGATVRCESRAVFIHESANLVSRG